MAKYSKPKSGSPSLGFDCKPTHAYLGHFKQEQHLRKGHNFSFPGSGILGDAANKLSGGIIGGGGGGSSRPSRPTKKQLADPSFREKHKVAAARADVRAAKKSGSEGDVQQAIMARKAAVQDRKDSLKTVSGARKALNQAKSQGMGGGVVRTARQALKTARATTKQSYAGALANQDAARAARKRAKESGGGLFSKVNPF